MQESKYRLWIFSTTRLQLIGLALLAVAHIIVKILGWHWITTSTWLIGIMWAVICFVVGRDWLKIWQKMWQLPVGELSSSVTGLYWGWSLFLSFFWALLVFETGQAAGFALLSLVWVMIIATGIWGGRKKKT